MRGSAILSYESICLIAACFFYYNDDKMISIALFVTSVLVWVSCFGAQFQDSERDSDENNRDETFD